MVYGNILYSIFSEEAPDARCAMPDAPIHRSIRRSVRDTSQLSTQLSTTEDLRRCDTLRYCCCIEMGDRRAVGGQSEGVRSAAPAVDVAGLLVVAALTSQEGQYCQKEYHNDFVAPPSVGLSFISLPAYCWRQSNTSTWLLNLIPKAL